MDCCMPKNTTPQNTAKYIKIHSSPQIIMQYKQALLSVACSFEYSNAFEVPEPDLAQDFGTSMLCPTQHRIPKPVCSSPGLRRGSALMADGVGCTTDNYINISWVKPKQPKHTHSAAFCSNDRCRDSQTMRSSLGTSGALLSSKGRQANLANLPNSWFTKKA